MWNIPFVHIIFMKRLSRNAQHVRFVEMQNIRFNYKDRNERGAPTSASLPILRQVKICYHSHVIRLYIIALFQTYAT